MTTEERPELLNSVTYKVRIPGIDAAMYVTVSDMNGVIRELFINSKHMLSFPWISYLTRTVSKRLQEGADIEQLISEMYETYDTDGGYIVPKSGGFRANSVVADIGWLLQQHWDQLKDAKLTERGEAE